MDIKRPDQTKAKQRKRLTIIMVSAFVLAAITIFLARLEPAAPTVERNLVWIDTVKRGEMIRQVRGLGTLVPEEIRWVAARTRGRVDRIVLRPGAVVEPGSLILVLANPDVGALEGQLRQLSSQVDNINIARCERVAIQRIKCCIGSIRKAH